MFCRMTLSLLQFFLETFGATIDLFDGIQIVRKLKGLGSDIYISTWTNYIHDIFGHPSKDVTDMP